MVTKDDINDIVNKLKLALDNYGTSNVSWTSDCKAQGWAKAILEHELEVSSIGIKFSISDMSGHVSTADLYTDINESVPLPDHIVALLKAIIIFCNADVCRHGRVIKSIDENITKIKAISDNMEDSDVKDSKNDANAV